MVSLVWGARYYLNTFWAHLNESWYTDAELNLKRSVSDIKGDNGFRAQAKYGIYRKTKLFHSHVSQNVTCLVYICAFTLIFLVPINATPRMLNPGCRYYVLFRHGLEAGRLHREWWEFHTHKGSLILRLVSSTPVCSLFVDELVSISAPNRVHVLINISETRP